MRCATVAKSSPVKSSQAPAQLMPLSRQARQRRRNRVTSHAITTDYLTSILLPMATTLAFAVYIHSR